MFTFVQSDPGDLLLPILCPVSFVRFDSLNMFSLARIEGRGTCIVKSLTAIHNVTIFWNKNLVQFKSADTYQHMI